MATPARIVTLAASGLLLALAAGAATAQDGLGSPRPVAWRLAALEAARRGPDALPELEDVAPLESERACLALSIMLLEHEGAWAALEARCPRLLALARPRAAEARRLARSLEGQDVFDTGEAANLPPGVPQPGPDETQRTLAALEAAAGFSIPALLEFTRSTHPGTRLYAVEVLTRLGAPAATARLTSLRRDPAAVRVHGSDWQETTTVGEHVTQVLASRHPWAVPQDAADEAERYLIRLDWGVEATTLINRLRARTSGAASWDDYWRRARPGLDELFRGR